MTLSWKALKKGVPVVAVVALLSSLFVASVAAQPPTPPNRFYGKVTLNGQPATAGTSVAATIGGTACGSTTVKSDGTYVLDVVSSGQTAGCGTEGAAISFSVAGNPAGSGTWSSGKFTQLDLAGQAAAPTAAPQPTVARPTPQVPTGSGGYLNSGSGTPWGTYASVLALVLLGAAGVAALRRYAR